MIILPQDISRLSDDGARNIFNDVFKPALQSGDTRKLEDYFRQHSHCDHASQEATLALEELCARPDGIQNPVKMMELLLENRADIIHALSEAERSHGSALGFERRLWRSDMRDASTDQVLAHATKIAEYLRYRIATGGEYQLPLTDLVTPDSCDMGQREKREAELARLVIFNQNALVDYMAINGMRLPVNRGAGFLRLMDDQPGSELWQRKVVAVKEEQAAAGLVVIKAAVYAP